MKFNLVAIEETRYWDPEITKKTGRIFTAYAYCPRQMTHCCEVTPSYYLEPVDFFFENELEVQESDPDGEFYSGVFNQWSAATTEGIYMHCRSVEAIPLMKDGFRMKYESKSDFEDEEEAYEYFRGNQFLFKMGM